jgi:hypothetical protein
MSSQRRLAVLFLATVAGFVICGLVAATICVLQAVRQHAVVQSLLDARGRVYYDHEVDVAGNPIYYPKPSNQGWTGAIFAVDVLHVPVRAEIGQLGFGVRTGLKDYHFNRDVWTALEQLKSVRWLDFSGTDVTDDELLRLQRLPELRGVDLTDTRIGDTGLGHIAAMRKLQHVCLVGTRVSDAGLQSLTKLDQLERLLLSDTSVTDGGLAHLRFIPSLKYVSLAKTGVTASAVRELRRALPMTEVSYRDQDSQENAGYRPGPTSPCVRAGGSVHRE